MGARLVRHAHAVLQDHERQGAASRTDQTIIKQAFEGRLYGSRAVVCKACTTPVKLEVSEQTRKVQRWRAKRRLKFNELPCEIKAKKKKSTKRLRQCLLCQNYMGPTAKRCKTCGSPLHRLQDRRKAQRGLRTGERKKHCLLFSHFHLACRIKECFFSLLRLPLFLLHKPLHGNP